MYLLQPSREVNHISLNAPTIHSDKISKQKLLFPREIILTPLFVKNNNNNKLDIITYIVKILVNWKPILGRSIGSAGSTDRFTCFLKLQGGIVRLESSVPIVSPILSHWIEWLFRVTYKTEAGVFLRERAAWCKNKESFGMKEKISDTPSGKAILWMIKKNVLELLNCSFLLL